MANDDTESAFKTAAALWDKRLAEAGDALDAAEPSPNVWDRISARIDAIVAARDTLTIPADHGHWETFAPGVRRKLLHVDAEGGWQSLLLRIDPGASVPAHAHPILEECLVLEGAFELDGETVGKGDLHLAFAGHDHGEIASATGALLYIRTAVGG
jgi:quercetin dioxygenase-like cupin family protein